MTFSDDLLSHLSELRAYARTMGSNKAASDDLVQATISRALAAQHRFQPGTNLRAWLFTIMRNIHISELRQHNLRRFYPLDEVPEHLTELAPGQIAAIELQELRDALKTVPVPQREALVLVNVMGCRYEEAAEISGCEVGTIKSRVNRAKGHLARALGRSYFQSEALFRSAPVPKADGKATRVLIAEDEFAIASEYERMIKELGAVPVGRTPSGSGAIRLAGHRKPDLILMDVRLSGPTDGISAAIKIRSKVDTPVVFVTAYDDVTMRSRIREFNGTQPLSKPLRLSELASAIASAAPTQRQSEGRGLSSGAERDEDLSLS